MQRFGFSAALCFCAALLSANPALANPLTIMDSNGEEIAVYDAAALDAMDNATIETTTPWTDGVDRYDGVSLQKLLDAAGAEGDAYSAMALNDYAVSIPAEIIAEHEPIVATHMNGVRLTLDNKGPYWVMFNFDSPKVKEIPEIRGLSIWALTEIEVE